MKKIIVMLAFCLLGVSLFAQERVAILPFTGGEEGEGDAIARLLGTELAELGNFRIVSRTAAIDKVMEEHQFQRGGLTDGDTIVELGKGANADYVVSGHIQSLGDRKMISASILDVETFQQVAGDYYEYDDLSEVRAYLPTLAEKLVSKTKKDYSDVPTLAILPFDGVDENNADVLAQLLSIELANREEYAVISRTGAIEKVMEEQNIQRSGITDADTIAELGRGVNAEYVVAIHIRNLGSKKILLGSILHVETFQQVVGDYYEYNNLDEIMNYLPTLANELASQTKKDYSDVPTLSILPFDGVDENNADVLAQLLAIEIANSGKYVVVSRTSTIESVMKEQNIQRSGITDGETIAKLGAATNADYVLSGSVTSLGSDDLMIVEIIDVLSLETKDGANVEYKTIEDGIILMPELAYDLTKRDEDEARVLQVLKEDETRVAQVLEEDMLQDLEKFKKGKWAGRGTWIGGVVFSVGAGTAAFLSINVEEPSRSSYSSYNDYEQAYNDYLSDGERNIIFLTTLAIVGGAAIIGGVITDIIFSVRENKLQEKFEAQGFSISAVPVITPDFTSGSINYGVQVAVKFSF